MALPHPAESMERHDYLGLDPEVWERLLAASAAAPDRLLKPVRAAAASRRSLNRGRRIPVRTFADWDRPPPGFLETGLAATASASVGPRPRRCWPESSPWRWRDWKPAGQLPFPVLGIGSDNDAVFINDTLTECCAQRGNQFTRSRACRKNDQARIELKNGAVVRRFLGRERYSGQAAGQP